MTTGTTLIGPTGAPLVADVVIAAVRQRGTIGPVVDGRIVQAPS